MKRLFVLSLVAVFLIAGISYAEQKETLKIAVASDGKEPTSNVSSLAGRSPYYLIFDNSGKLIETVENPYKDARGGAGLSIVDVLARKGVKTIVAGTFGDRMISAMKGKGMKYHEFKGSVNDAVKKVLSLK